MEFSEQPNGCVAGPILHFRGWRAGRVALSAVVWRREGQDPLPLETGDGSHPARAIGRSLGLIAWRHDFDLPAQAEARYRIGEASWPVRTDLAGDMRIAFAACNGQEDGDVERDEAERNAMWSHLGDLHRARPFSLLLQGGDQIYADEMGRAHPLMECWPDPKAPEIPQAREIEVENALREAFHRRYLQLLRMEAPAWIQARAPSLMMWDDHDICDGWGSLPAPILDSRRGRILFKVAREAMLLFQMGCPPDERPDICSVADPDAFGWEITIPGLTILAPDLRAQRRPKRVMAETGWDALTAGFARARERQKDGGRVFLLSTVPALGPRLSWVEWLLNLSRRMEEYEDDLRDQWQSRAHREEWRRLLRLMVECHEAGAPVTALSGEIHLATRGEMDTAAGPIRQLVASGITHPAPPRAYALGLGALAKFGEAPLPEHPIRLRALPGRRQVYQNQRNFLTLDRRDGRWSAVWELEKTGPTPAMPL